MNKSMKETEAICLYLISPDYVGDTSPQENNFKQQVNNKFTLASESSVFLTQTLTQLIKYCK